ncbi:MAG: N-acetylmuramoyl-L-alanine amidase [Acidobacteria bacterium]|jgi:N-acetylmuramoyl-L-alanine amidase|nr:N-acetylmuramoyl-L-alanine amidase [Acidobacteriota bacterium]
MLKGFGRQRTSTLARGLAALALVAAPVAAQPASSPLTVLTTAARREVSTVVRDGAEMVAIEDVAVGFGMTVTSDARGGAATLSVGSHEVGLYEGKSLASVDGDLRLLSAPVRHESRRWLVPVDGVPRLLEPLLGQPVEWRAGPRVLVVGRVPVPRVSVSTFASADVVRVVFDASESVPFRVEQGSDRITVAIDRELVDATVAPGRPAGGIVESVEFAGGTENTFTVRLGPLFREVRASEQESPPRLVLELQGEVARADAAAPEEPAPAPRPRPRPAQEPAADVIQTIVIDPGHGGEEVGARGPGGTLEKNVALAIARRLRDEVVNTLGVQVFLTRTRDVEMELDDRTAIANNYKADLFVSIHANAVRARGAKGSEVYFLSYQASDEESRRMAQMEGAAEPLGSVEPGSDLAVILWDMAQAEHLEESSALATRIQEELAAVTGSESRGVKQAPFRVLVGAAMPAVLVEVAFISNPEEEKLLGSGAYQAKIARALMRGIARYRRERAARLGPGTAGRP